MKNGAILTDCKDGITLAVCTGQLGAKWLIESGKLAQIRAA
jgi:hypothetical protein